MGVGTAADGVVHGVELKYEDEARVRAGRLGTRLP